MTDYEKRLEAENASLHMALDASYDDAGKLKRQLSDTKRIIRNAIIITEQSNIGEKTKNRIVNELLRVLEV